jgi:NAD(P)-dependent dehydrogenase (short-subunit alcohol dehydrogenase family)
MNLQSCVVIVTGASAGIGWATALALGQAGAHVVVTARRVERLEALVEAFGSFNGRIITIPGNIQEESFCKDLIAQTVAEFGRVDVLINNAGVGHKSAIAEIPSADLDTIWGTNVAGLLFASQAAIVQMKEQGHGCIVNVSSIVGERPLPQGGVYCASKTAVNFLSRTMRMELRPYNIKVIQVYPGRTATEFGDALLGETGSNPSSIGRVSAERVADKIVRGIRNGREHIYITMFDWLFVQASRHFPGTTDWLIDVTYRRKK